MKKIFSSLFSIIDRTIETIITIAFTLMVLSGGMQVFFRYVLKHSLSWSEEFQKYMHIWIIFLAIPLAYKNGAHIGMKVMYDKFPGTVQYILTLLFDALWFSMGCVMVYYTVRIMKIAKMQTSPGLGLRMDMVYSCILIGGVYLCFTAARNIAGHIVNKSSEFTGRDTG